MTFESIFFSELHTSGFGSQPYLKTFKKRPHVSKSKIDAYSNCVYLKVGDFFSKAGYSDTDSRYISATSMTYDIFMSIYDVNTQSVAAARFLELTSDLNTKFGKFIKSLRRPNLEVRLIGMQDAESALPLYGVADMIAQNRLSVYEIDLFGKNIRHIAFDISSGMSYNVLMEDKIYKPGELASKMTYEQFEKSLRG